MSPKSYILFSIFIIFTSAEQDNSKSIIRSKVINLLGCECMNYDCGCCQHIKETHLVHLDDTVCANITYLPKDLGISVTVTFDSYAVINQTVSVRNPPALCIGQPWIKEIEAAICMRFYNLDANNHYLHGCVKFEVTFYNIRIAQYDAGCFDIGHKSAVNSTTNEHVIDDSVLRKLWFSDNSPQVDMI